MSALPSLVALLLALLALTPARAQGLDGHGEVLPPDGVEPTDALLSWHPVEAGSLSLGLIGEYAAAPLVRTVRDGDAETREVLLDHVVGVNLGALIGFRGGVGLGLSVPVWLGTGGAAAGGPAGGDVHLWVPLQTSRPFLGRRPDRCLGSVCIPGGLDPSSGPQPPLFRFTRTIRRVLFHLQPVPPHSRRIFPNSLVPTGKQRNFF